jgi:transcriptional regulator with XRE-family HTH domain
MQKKIGAKIRDIRLRQLMTLESVAKTSGIDKGYLSRIERGQKSPSISTIVKLSAALDVDIADFFQGGGEDVKCAIIRRKERHPITRDGTAFGYHYESLTFAKPNRNFEAFIFTLVAIDVDPPIMSHPGEELFFVLQGKMEFGYRDKKYILCPGDCAYFDAEEPHSARSLDGKETRALSFVIPRPRRDIKSQVKSRSGTKKRKC